MKEVKECCSARDVLWYLVFTGFAVNYMTRTNLNIALVSMVKPRDNSEILSNECAIKNGTDSFQTYKEAIVKSPNATSTERIALSTTRSGPTKELSKVYDWNEKEQGSILGSFFWIHWLTQIPGGVLAARYGTKIVFGLSNFGAVLFIYIIPVMAHKGSFYLTMTRAIQGLVSGFAWPAMHHLTAQWIPPNDRSKFVTAYLGSSVGTAITYPLCGFIIDRWGWELVFYVNGVLGTIWFIAWSILVHDSPQVHPRISDNEKNYIISCLGESVSNKKAPIPWTKMLTSLPVWMNIIAQVGGAWGMFTLMTTGPTYFKFIHGWNIRETGLLAGMPHLTRMLFAFIISQLGDFLLRTHRMSITNVRKMATALCCVLQGVFTICLSYSGCNRSAAIVFFTLAVASNGAVSTGPLASVVDMTPNYASVLLGIMNTFVTMNGFLTTAVVGFLTYQNQTAHQWQKVYWISSGLMISCGMLYCVFSNSELQPWNTQETQNVGPDTEMMIIENKSQQSDEKTTLVRENNEKST